MNPNPPAGPEGRLAAEGPRRAGAPPDLLPGAALRDCVLPFHPRPITLWVVDDPLALARAEPEEKDGEVYWGELWPASIALAGTLLSGQTPLPDSAAPVLELGCGAGLGAVGAALAGAGRARVLATDRDERALALTAANARRNGVGELVRTQRLDWREPYTARHLLILASDCLYGPDAPREFLGFLRQALDRRKAPAARAVVVDPDRWSARDFFCQAQEAGFRVEKARRVVPFTGVHHAVRMPASGPPTDADLRVNQSIEATFYQLTWG